MPSLVNRAASERRCSKLLKNMRFSAHFYLAIAISALLLASLGCQSAQKSSFLPPSQAQAPALVAASSQSASQAQKPAIAGSTGAPSQPQASTVAPAADPIADLIERVEKEYQAGQDNYNAEHLEAAKQDFDSAIQQLLSSGFDLKSDDRLQREFDRLVEAIDMLETDALQQGDTLPVQQSEPAPIDEANELTPTVDQNVKAKAEAEIKSTHSDLPLMMTDQVAGYINYFSTRGRGTVERALARSGRYEDMIRGILRQEGLPQDLIYLAQAESGFHPLAVSRAGARGMWQFMGSRAKGYGLERSWWVDDRQDPEKATRAAAHHLKDLYNQFGDWYLAMAAYNSGPGTVQSAVKRTGYADFWELYRRNVLPKETRNYVPIILAVTIMAKNPAQYGLDSVIKDKPVPYDTIKIGYPIDLRLAAECVDATPSDLLDLNPSLLRLTTPRVTEADREFELHLPAGTADRFETAVAAIPADKRVWWRYHKVQNGETLASIARTYHTTAKAIAAANELSEGSVEAESRLIIPIAAGKQSDTSTYARATTHYKVRKGDTVESVAENFGVSPKMLRGWNRIKGDSLAGRKVLYIHLPVTPGSVPTQVASSRPPVARRHSAMQQSISQKVTPQSLVARHVTKEPQHAATESAAVTGNATVAKNAAVVHHKVKPGETLYSIASSYKTTVTALQQDNHFLTNLAALRPGMILVVRESH